MRPRGSNFQNDDRYYGWSTFLPAAGDPGGDMRAPTTAASGNNHAWKILMQFHSIGECDTGGPNLSVGLKRART